MEQSIEIICKDTTCSISFFNVCRGPIIPSPELGKFWSDKEFEQIQHKQTSDALTQPLRGSSGKKEKKKKKPAHLDLNKLLFFVLVVLPPFYDANVTYIKIFSCVLIFICFYDRNHHNNSNISVFTLNVRTQDKLDT